MQDYLSKLSEEQIKPVTDTEGAVLVIAGAGSGKTRVLTSRIAYLVDEKKVDPYNILAITFTNKAADEMKERLGKLIGDISQSWVCTIHSMCVKILRRYADKLGYKQDFSIYSETDKDKVLKRVILGLALQPDKYLKTSKNLISSLKNKDMSTEEFAAENPRMRNLTDYVKIIDEYNAELFRSNAMDFDDLLIKTYHLLAENHDVLEKISGRFYYIHVDEFQDTNFVQYNIVKLLSTVHGNLFVVGDDDQSIYGWRGADINNILDFEKDFKGAKTYKLERNYRSTKRILDLANTVIAHNTKRKNKVLWTDNEEGVKAEVFVADEESGEAQYTAVQIKTLLQRGYKYSDFAVLMRINALSRSYEQEFMKYGIPCKVYGGFKFFERKEIKDITAYLRILCNPLDNEAILRVINVPKRGIGDKSVEEIKAYSEKKGLSVFDGVYDCENLDLNSGAKAKIRSFRDTISKLVVAKETMPLLDLVKEVIDKTDFMSCFAEDTPENDDKKKNVNEFLSSVEEFARLNPNAPLSEYLNSITLSSDTDEINEGEYVTLATVHSVKGLEYRCVFICGLDQKIFPIERDYEEDNEEEERRLMYVAITRARERLFLTRARSRFLYGSRSATVQSQFLDDLSEKLGLKINRGYGGYNNGYSGDSDYGNNYSGGYGGYENGYGSGYGSGYGNSYGNKYGENGYKREYRNSKTAYGSGYGYSAGGNDFGTSKSYGSFKTNSYAKSYSASSNKPTEKVDSGELGKFKAGVAVRHKKFGDGVIISTKNNGGEIVADVAFKGVGIKSLVLRLAPIEVVE